MVLIESPAIADSKSPDLDTHSAIVETKEGRSPPA
jgi:hypothetical protein